MNTNRRATAGLMVLSVFIVPAAFSADLDLSWCSVDGGGGYSSSGDFEVEGTVGQPDAGSMLTGGDYSLSGGFWPGGSASSVEVCLGDLDGNSQTNLADHAVFFGCLDGPGVTWTADCEVADLDMDGDADLADFAAFQIGFGCPQS